MACGDIFQAIADPTRRNLLDRLRPGEQSVTQLAAPFDISKQRDFSALANTVRGWLGYAKAGRTNAAIQAECRAAKGSK